MTKKANPDADYEQMLTYMREGTGVISGHDCVAFVRAALAARRMLQNGVLGGLITRTDVLVWLDDFPPPVRISMRAKKGCG